MTEPLTRREGEILGLLEQGFTAPEIAERLTLAFSSVKWHIQRLYGKLDANTRRQAVQRARELGLLPPTVGPLSLEPSQPASASRRHNLPQPVTHFFGREFEIEQVRRRLTEHRLVTLTGSGGVGKSRLSLRVAEAALPDFVDGVWFVELAALADPAQVPHEIARVLGAPTDLSRPILETLQATLHARQMLIILDNCEHLLAACAKFADALLPACPRLRILVSSREPLGAQGEAICHVPSLPFPDASQSMDYEHIAKFPAVRLFVDRARLVLPNYILAAHNASAVARICQRLDGIPLAIEMAAARVNLLTADQLASRLDEAFRLLTSGSRNALPQHKTLRATLDWSYALLNEPERLLLQRLSVFAGGCTLEAVEVVCVGSGLEVDEILPVLSSLVAKSVVQAFREQTRPARYKLLEMVRQYAAEALAASGQDVIFRCRHRDYFVAFAERTAPSIASADGPVRARVFQAEPENLRLALEWSFADLTDPAAAPRLIVKMYRLWPARQDAIYCCRRSLLLCQSRTDIPAEVYAELLAVASSAAALNDPYLALDWAKQAVEVGRALAPASRKILMNNLRLLGWRYQRDLSDGKRAVAPYEEAEALFHELGPASFSPQEHRFLTAWFANIQATLALEQGQPGAAKRHAEDSVRLFEQAGYRTAFQYLDALTCLGQACLQLGEYEQASNHFQEAISAAHEIGNDHGPNREAYATSLLAFAALRQGDVAAAAENCRIGLRLAVAIYDRNVVATCLGLMAEIATMQKRAARAATLAGAALALFARQKRKPPEDVTLDTLLLGWSDGPDRDAITRAFDQGQRLGHDDAVVLALDDKAA